MGNKSAEPYIGMVLDKKYRIDSLLGGGGMGKVYLVKHTQLGKTFALKLMSFNDTDSDPNQLLRFKREARLLAKIDHPNVVTITDFGVTDDLAPYIVMEYIEGITLRKFIAKKGRLSEKDAIN